MYKDENGKKLYIDKNGTEWEVVPIPKKKRRRWEIKYKGWTITHDPYGALACYRNDNEPLQWCYFGCSLDVIKMEIDRREYLANEH